MAFKDSEVQDLLVKCHRRCCICHKFCGVKIEIDHIVPRADGGTDDISNAIAVCFECHAEIHLYNPEHPKGRRFTSEELRHHRDQWLEICRSRPDALVRMKRANTSLSSVTLKDLTYSRIEDKRYFGKVVKEAGESIHTALDLIRVLLKPDSKTV